MSLARSTKKAIDVARDEFLSSNRQKIRVKRFWLASDIWQGVPIIINMTCVNNGTTDAILAEIGFKFFVVKKDKLIPIEPNIPAILKLGGARLSCARNWITNNIIEGKILTNEENVKIQNQTYELYCVGYISYLDEAKRMRITGFCRVLSFPENTLAHIGNCRFRVFRDRDYEYAD
jgi:hypothetical protein